MCQEIVLFGETSQIREIRPTYFAIGRNYVHDSIPVLQHGQPSRPWWDHGNCTSSESEPDGELMPALLREVDRVEGD
jgi:hypothetical protein